LDTSILVKKSNQPTPPTDPISLIQVEDINHPPIQKPNNNNIVTNMAESFAIKSLLDQIKPFTGLNADASTWVEHWKDMMRLGQVADKYQLVYLAGKLQESALTWFKRLPAKQPDHSDWNIATVLNLLVQQYASPNDALSALIRLRQIAQGTHSVDEYAYELEKAINKAEPTMSEKGKVAAFVTGLNKTLAQTLISTTTPTTLGSVIASARSIEDSSKVLSMPTSTTTNTTTSSTTLNMVDTIVNQISEEFKKRHPSPPKDTF
jgi:hypothetical protein